MRLHELTADILPISGLILEAPAFGAIPGEDGLPCRVWKNPTAAAFRRALGTGTHGTSGLRGLLTATDIYIWQSNSLLHGGFVRQTGIDGVRVGLRVNLVQINEETVAFPEHFPWVFPNPVAAGDLDIEQRRPLVTTWMKKFRPMLVLYPTGFSDEWYM